MIKRHNTIPTAAQRSNQGEECNVERAWVVTSCGQPVQQLLRQQQSEQLGESTLVKATEGS